MARDRYGAGPRNQNDILLAILQKYGPNLGMEGAEDELQMLHGDAPFESMEAPPPEGPPMGLAGKFKQLGMKPPFPGGPVSSQLDPGPGGTGLPPQPPGLPPQPPGPPMPETQKFKDLGIKPPLDVMAGEAPLKPGPLSETPLPMRAGGPIGAASSKAARRAATGGMDPEEFKSLLQMLMRGGQ